MFETTLIASRWQKGLRQRLLALPAAIAIHGLAVTFFVVGQLWATGPVPEPTLVVGFYQPPPPPPPAGRPPTTKPPEPRNEPTEPPKTEVQPLSVPSASAQPLPQQDPVSGGAGVVGGVPGGDPLGGPGGIPGGVTTGQPAEPAPSIDDDIPVPDQPGMQLPVPLVRIDPRYPEVARRVKVQGPVILEAIIARDGQVVDARILRDIGFGCGEAALEAVRQWRYQPARLNGRNVTVYLRITVNFQLS